MVLSLIYQYLYLLPLLYSYSFTRFPIFIYANPNLTVNNDDNNKGNNDKNIENPYGREQKGCINYTPLDSSFSTLCLII